jgi:hypothetical protein
MLTPLDGLPDGVLGFEATGEIHADDYKAVLNPAVQEQLAKGNDIRMVLVFPRWDGFSAGAAWEDLKMGVDHLSRWKRIALVTDLDWMTRFAHLFGWMTPGEMKHFALADQDAAVAWAAGA